MAAVPVPADADFNEPPPVPHAQAQNTLRQTLADRRQCLILERKQHRQMVQQASKRIKAAEKKRARMMQTARQLSKADLKLIYDSMGDN